MPAYYNKRRKSPGPNKNEARVMRRHEFESRDSGALGRRFPSVSRLLIQLEFLSPQNQVMSQEARTFHPSDTINLSVPCPGRCGVGSFDLEGKIAKVVEAHEAVSEAGGKCQQELYAGASDVCGCQLKCRIEISYVPDSATAQPAI